MMGLSLKTATAPPSTHSVTNNTSATRAIVLHTEPSAPGPRAVCTQRRGDTAGGLRANYIARLSALLLLCSECNPPCRHLSRPRPQRHSGQDTGSTSEGSGFDSRQRHEICLFFVTSRPALRPTQPPSYTVGTGDCFHGSEAAGA
jgi:hypothetical protein